MILSSAAHLGGGKGSIALSQLRSQLLQFGQLRLELLQLSVLCRNGLAVACSGRRQGGFPGGQCLFFFPQQRLSRPVTRRRRSP